MGNPRRRPPARSEFGLAIYEPDPTTKQRSRSARFPPHHYFISLGHADGLDEIIAIATSDAKGQAPSLQHRPPASAALRYKEQLSR